MCVSSWRIQLIVYLFIGWSIQAYIIPVYYGRPAFVPRDIPEWICCLLAIVLWPIVVAYIMTPPQYKHFWL
jgi:hypothetical protein